MADEIMDFSLLSRIDSPADIRRLERHQLAQLADAINEINSNYVIDAT